MHRCEPNLEELKIIEKALMVAESTDLNVKKLEALQIQIGRHEVERDAQAEAAKRIEKAEADAKVSTE